MNRAVDPANLMRLGVEWWAMMAEAQSVVTLRMLGMAGMWPVAAGENRLMVAEKGPAIARSMMAAGAAAVSAQRPDQVAMAAVKPLRAKTRANARRLKARM